MKRALVLPLAAILVVALVPIADAQEGEDPDCIQPPDVEESYEWAYELSNGRTRYVEVMDQGPATTTRGHHNITKLGFEEQDEDGDRAAWGRQVRFAPDTPYPWAVSTQDRWEHGEASDVRKMDAYDPPFQVIHRTHETCPGDFWRFTTHHTIAYGEYGQAGQEQGNESWQVRAGQWTNVTVPDGTYEVMPVTAVRVSDQYEMTTYWSPEVQAPAKVEQGPADATTQTRELTWHILDVRPTPIFEVTPLHPAVGDTITLNATASHDPEGPITAYRWHVNDEVHHGPVVELNATEETTWDIRLFVTDDANRTSTLGTTRYIAPEEGSGLGVSGPDEALRGEIVTLEAHPSFDPVDVRWRLNGTVVGDGDVYQFYMEEPTNLSVDAFHETGRVYTTNHTVELVERAADGSEGGGDADERPRVYYPPGGSEELAILEPLEGQVVPQTFTAHVRASGSASLMAGSLPVWQGSAPSGERVSLTLDPGDHTLSLEGPASTQTVNVTVASDGEAPGSDAQSSEEASTSEASEPTPVPAPSALLVAALGAAVASLRQRER